MHYSTELALIRMTNDLLVALVSVNNAIFLCNFSQSIILITASDIWLTFRVPPNKTDQFQLGS